MSDFDRLMSAVEQVLTLPPSDRIAFIDSYCRGDESLRADILRLVQAETKIGEFLESPPILPNEAAQIPTYDGPPQLAGFRVTETIGHGGMGIVYRAIDQSLNREVAIKVMRVDLMNQTAARMRFLEEAKITGRLQHPGVPAVYQMGVTNDRRPFLAMKLIGGQSLQSAISQQTLSAFDPLTILEAICQTVAYAHQHGIIHRDLKPHNVMIGSFGEVQVLDWGLAKAISLVSELAADSTILDPNIPEPRYDSQDVAADADHRNVPKPMLTAAGSVMGTPSYMAPEQAQGNHERIGPTTDVFAIGAILCTMLTGKPPFLAATPDEVRKKAAAGDLADAWSRLDASGQPSDLIQLCKDCLAVEQVERPRNAGVLAERVNQLRLSRLESQRQSELARAKAEVERAEAIKQRRFTVQATSAIASVLLVGLLATAWQAYRASVAESSAKSEAIAKGKALELADRSAKEATAQTKLAEKELANQKSMTALFQSDFLQHAGTTAQIDRRLPDDPTGLIRNALTRVTKGLHERLGDRPSVEASVRATIADTMTEFKRPDLAITEYNQAIKTLAEIHGPNHLETLNTRHNLGLAYRYAEQYPKALSLLRETHAAMSKHLGPNHLSTLTCLHSIAGTLVDVEQVEEAAKLYPSLIADEINALGADHDLALSSQAQWAQVLMNRGQLAESISKQQSVISIMQKKRDASEPEFLQVRQNLAAAYWRQQEIKKAITIFEELLALREKLNQPRDPQTADLQANLGINYRDDGQFAKAIKLLESAAWVAQIDEEKRWVPLELLRTYLRANELKRVEECAQQVLLQAHRNKSESKGDFCNALLLVGNARLRLAQYTEAEKVLRELNQQFAWDFSPGPLAIYARMLLGQAIGREQLDRQTQKSANDPKRLAEAKQLLTSNTAEMSNILNTFPWQIKDDVHADLLRSRSVLARLEGNESEAKRLEGELKSRQR